MVVGLALPVALELSARAEDFVRFGVPITSQVSGVGELSVVDSQGVHGRPGASYRHFRINTLGFRGPEERTDSLAMSAVVIATGSSETFGLYESPEHEWPRIAQRLLASSCADQRVTVLNAATAGMSQPWVSVDLQNRLAALHPRLLVYYLQPTQYLWDQVPTVRYPAKPGAGDQPAFASRVAFRLRTEIKDATPGWLLDALRRRDTEASRSSGAVPFDGFPRERLDSLDRHLGALIADAKRRAIPLALVIPYHRFGDTISTSVDERQWMNAWERQVPKASGHLLMQFTDSAVARIRNAARDSGVALVDAAFPQSRQRAQYFADPVHFSDAGAAVVADSVARVTIDLLGCRQASSRSLHLR